MIPRPTPDLIFDPATPMPLFVLLVVFYTEVAIVVGIVVSAVLRPPLAVLCFLVHGVLQRRRWARLAAQPSVRSTDPARADTPLSRGSATSPAPEPHSGGRGGPQAAVDRSRAPDRDRSTVSTVSTASVRSA